MSYLRTGYMKLNKAIAERVARRQARNGDDPEREAQPESDVEVVRKSTERARAAYDRLLRAIDEALS